MSAKRAKDDQDDELEAAGVAVAADDAAEVEDQPLQLSVAVKQPSACERHVTVTIPRDDINRYFDNAYGEMMPNAAVPGFRIGRAPRKIVESRFKDQVTDQVKSAS